MWWWVWGRISEIRIKLKKDKENGTAPHSITARFWSISILKFLAQKSELWEALYTKYYRKYPKEYILFLTLWFVVKKETLWNGVQFIFQLGWLFDTNDKSRFKQYLSINPTLQKVLEGKLQPKTVRCTHKTDAIDNFTP